jgi:hypothetical protein
MCCRGVSGQAQGQGDAELRALRMQRPGVRDADEKSDARSRVQDVYGQPVVDQAAIARESIEAVAERGARPEGVLDEIQRAARQPFGHVDADRLVSSHRHRQTPGLA